MVIRSFGDGIRHGLAAGAAPATKGILMYVPPLQKECPVCHHMVAINYVRGKEVQRCFCGARQSSRGGGDATLLALRQYDKRRAELNER